MCACSQPCQTRRGHCSLGSLLHSWPSTRFQAQPSLPFPPAACRLATSSCLPCLPPSLLPLPPTLTDLHPAICVPFKCFACNPPSPLFFSIVLPLVHTRFLEYFSCLHALQTTIASPSPGQTPPLQAGLSPRPGARALPIPTTHRTPWPRSSVISHDQHRFSPSRWARVNQEVECPWTPSR